MNNKYIYGSLCSIAPMIIYDTGYVYTISNIKDHSINSFEVETITVNLNYTIHKKHHTVYKLVLLDVNLSKKVSNLFSNKSDLCLFILSKIYFLKCIFRLYNNLNGLQLLSRHKRLSAYFNYSQNILDYKEVYSVAMLKTILYDLNKIVSQNSKCISKYKTQTFQKILQILKGTDLDDKFLHKIDSALTNNDTFTKIYNKYIKNINYYVNLGELFNV